MKRSRNTRRVVLSSIPAIQTAIVSSLLAICSFSASRCVSMSAISAPYYDLSVFLAVSAEKQRERILKRNAPAHAKQFFDRWIPLEQRYFDALDVKMRCDLILPADG